MAFFGDDVIERGPAMLPDPTAHWLPAAPFRSHVRALMDDTGLPWRAIALAARVPPATVRTLLVGRGGRARSKIHRAAAGNLMRLTGVDLHLLRVEVVPAARLRRLTLRLQAHGCPTPEVARLLRLTPSQVRAVASGAARWSDSYTTLLARAACDARCPDDREAAYDDALAGAVGVAEEAREPAVTIAA